MGTLPNGEVKMKLININLLILNCINTVLQLIGFAMSARIAN